MWLEECDSFAELCRGYLPYYLLIVLPIFIIISPVNPVAASHEFPVYRMHQYDLHGVPHGKILIRFPTICRKIRETRLCQSGCRSAPISLEARSLAGWSTSKHCVVARALDIIPSVFQAIRSKAGALVIVLPEKMSELTTEEKQVSNRINAKLRCMFYNICSELRVL